LIAGRYSEAEKTALDAAEAPAWFPIRRQALFCAALSEGMLYNASRDPALRPKIAESLRKMYFVEPGGTLLKPQLAVNLAITVDELNLARLLLDDWQRQEPGNPQVQQFRESLKKKEEAIQSSTIKQQEKKDPTKRSP
jgi:hypothetical protein